MNRPAIKGNGRIRRFLRRAAVLAVLFIIMLGGWLTVFNAIEKEQQWRQDRLCRIYGVCSSQWGA